MKLFNKEKLDIALLGTTGLGKSRFISSFFANKDKAKLLHNDNKHGLTKINVRYTFGKFDNIEVTNIKVNNEDDIWRNSENKREVLKILNSQANTIEMFKNDIVRFCDNMKLDYDKCIQAINSSEKGYDILINCVYINVPASGAMQSLMMEQGLKNVTFRDFAGFLDDTSDTRDLGDVDAFVYLFLSPDVVNANQLGEKYGDFLRHSISAIPSFYMLRGKVMNAQNDENSFEKSIDFMYEDIEEQDIAVLNYLDSNNVSKTVGTLNELFNIDERRLLWPSIKNDDYTLDQIAIYNMRRLFKVIQEFRKRLIDIETKVERKEFMPYFNKAWNDIIDPINKTALYTGSNMSFGKWFYAESSVNEGIKGCISPLIFENTEILGERDGYNKKSTALVGNIAYISLERFCEKLYKYVLEGKILDNKSLKLFTVYLNYIQFKSWDSGNSSYKGNKVNRYLLKDAILETRKLQSNVKNDEALQRKVRYIIQKVIFTYLNNTKMIDVMNK